MTEPRVEPGLIERRPVHKGRIVDLGVDTVRYPDGSTGELEMIRHSGASAVLPVLRDVNGPDPQIVHGDGDHAVLPGAPDGARR